MGRSLGGLLAQLMIATTVFASNMLLVSIAGLLRLLPTVVPVLARFGWALVLLSCRLYYQVLIRVAPVVQERAGIDVLDGLWRLAVTVAMSIGIGLVLLFLAQWPVTVWTVLPFAIHGLFVDFIWDEIPEADGLEMGVRL